jgi:2-oxoglutarate dehydrogenase E2 component (dihydrolipoamide succinyltransferase)
MPPGGPGGIRFDRCSVGGFGDFLARFGGFPEAELKNIKGSGAGDRVNKSDLEAYIVTRGKGGIAVSAAKAGPAATAAPSGMEQTRGNGERVEIIAMDNMRKAIAKNMVLSKQTSPHVNSIDEIDMTNLVKSREKIKEAFKKREGINLTYSHFVLYAIVQALKDHPMVNSSLEGDNIVIKKNIHLGCAVAVPGNGLVVPVIKNAQDLNLTGIARQLDILATKAKTKKLTMDDLTGGTYTFTNNGSFGTLIATPVILQPQVGIFCTGVIKKRVMVMEEDAIAIRSMMYGTHTYDHRLIDGELGSKFLASVKFHLENMRPEELI